MVGRAQVAGGSLRGLRELRRGDRIVVTTTQGQTAYRVVSVREGRLGPKVLAPTPDDRLTLVTSASASPFASEQAIVVVARLQGRPFEPTPQGGPEAGVDGRAGDPTAWPQVALFALLFGAVAAGAILAHRTWRTLVAHLVTTPALVVFAVLVAESALRLFPAWS